MSTSQMLLEDRYMAERKALHKDDVQATVRYLRELGK